MQKLNTKVKFLTVLVLFVIGLLIRLYRFGEAGLGNDEIMTTIRINHSFLETIYHLRHSNFPPFYYAFLNLWVHTFGHGEWALRFPSVIFSSLTIIVIYKLGSEFFSKDVGISSALLLVFSPFSIHYAQFAKMYALFWFLVATAFLFFFRFLKDQSNHAYLFYIILMVLCCHTMYIGLLFLMAQSIIFLLMEEKNKWRQWFVGQLTIISICILWGVYSLSSPYDELSRMPQSSGTYYCGSLLKAFLSVIGSGLEIVEPRTQAPLSLEIYSHKINYFLNCFLYVFLIIFFIIDGAITSYKNKRKGTGIFNIYYCLLLWITVPTLGYFIFDYFLFPVHIQARYMGFLQVPIILLVSSQVNNFHGLIKRILLVVMIGIAVNNTHLYFKDKWLFPQEDWRKTAKELTQGLGPNDIVLSFSESKGFLEELKYYYKGDTRGFFIIPQKDCSTDFLVKKGILTKQVNAIFVLSWGDHLPSETRLDGFFLDYKVFNGGNGFFHFQRVVLKN